MSIFDKSTINEIPLGERFEIKNLSFDGIGNKRFYMSGDPLPLLINKDWMYPYWRAHVLEPKTFEDITWKIMSGQIRQCVYIHSYLNDIHRYDMRPEGFSCTCGDERVFIDGEKLFPEYRDTFNETTSLFSRLLTYSMIKSNIDVLFTPENCCPDNSFTYFDALGEHYNPYWWMCAELITNNMKRIINPDYTVSITPTIICAAKSEAVVGIEFVFLKYKSIPLQWWYCDRTKAYNWIQECDEKSCIKHISPKFNVYFNLVMIEQE